MPAIAQGTSYEPRVVHPLLLPTATGAAAVQSRRWPVDEALRPHPCMAGIDIGSSEIFSWRVRLEIERSLRNITDAHKAIIQYVADLAGDDLCQVSHTEIARALTRGARTIRDALRRARVLGLIDWQAHYEPRPGSVLRWRKANIFRRTMPHSPARARPEVRRHDGGTLRRARKNQLTRAQEAEQAPPERPRAAFGEIDLLTARRRQMEARWQIIAGCREAPL